MTGLADRIARCLPGASFELEALVRLVGIVETTDVDTASVTCAGRSRLQLNPDFVAEHCRSDEALFLLVMHEMWHVLLGHTTLYGRPTLRHNIAFDALINAGLCRQHPQPEYRGFFERLNPADMFPALLLRPPVGWPARPVYDVPGPEGTRRVLRRLYPPRGRDVPEPTYEEILALLDQVPVDEVLVRLVGDHREGAPAGESDPMSDPLFGSAVRDIVGAWPPPPTWLRGRDAGGRLRHSWVDRSDRVTTTLRRRFAAVLEQVLRPQRGSGATRSTVLERQLVGPGPLPNLADRTAHARRRLLGGVVLPNQTITVARRAPDVPRRALVYLDVSGSMASVLPSFVDLLAVPARQGVLQALQFSTEVAPVSSSDLAARRISTTGGTDIAPVLEHLATRSETTVLLVTDGYVGTAPPHLLQPLLDRGVRFHAVIPEGEWRHDLEDFATVHELPVR